MEPYRYRLLRRAWKMTAQDFGLREVWRFFIKLMLFFATLIMLALFGWHQILISSFGQSLAGALALVALIPFVFLFNLLLAPVQLQKEADDEIARLNLVIKDKEKIQKALDELWQLRRDGVQLRNRKITRLQLPGWVAEFEEWNAKVLDACGRVSPNLQNWLEVLDDTYGRPFNIPVVSGDHELKVRVMSEMLKRLQKYLVRTFF